MISKKSEICSDLIQILRYINVEHYVSTYEEKGITRIDNKIVSSHYPSFATRR